MFALLLPVTCAGCRRARGPVCAVCVAALVDPGRHAPVEGCDALIGAFAYAGVARAIVGAAKYRRHRGALRFLAERAAAEATAAAASGQIAPASLVTYAPTTGERRRARGFDPAEVIAAVVARSLGSAPGALLVRASDRAQTGRSAAQRRSGPTFRARGPIRSPVVLVDDVVTTGATLAAAAEALRTAGAPSVVAVVAAVTPARRRPTPSPPGQGAEYPGSSVVYGSVVASRSQSRAKRPT